jgi:hypothetical protein
MYILLILVQCTHNGDDVTYFNIYLYNGSIGPSNAYSLLLYLQLYRHGFRLFDGIDSSPGMLSVAEKKKKNKS